MFPLHAQGSESDWKLKRISIEGIGLDEVVNVPITIYNPLDREVSVREVFVTEEWARVDFREGHDVVLPPQRETRITMLSFSSTKPFKHLAYLHVKIAKDTGPPPNDAPPPSFVIPLSFDVLRPGLHLPAIIDFGILTSPDAVATLPVSVRNFGSEWLMVTGFHVQAPGVSLSPNDDIIIPPAGESVIWLSYSGEKEGEMEGNLRVMSNASDVRWMELDVSVKGRVVWGGVGWDVSKTWNKVTTKEMWLAKRVQEGTLTLGGDRGDILHKDRRITSSSVQFNNFFREKVKISNVSTIFCNGVVSIDEFESDEVIGYGRQWAPIRYSVRSFDEQGKASSSVVPSGDPIFTCNLRLQTNVSHHDIPMYLYDGKLRVQSGDDFNDGKASPCSSIDLRDCRAPFGKNAKEEATQNAIAQYLKLLYFDMPNSRPALLNFGAIGAIGASDVRSKSIYLTNFNPVPINVTISTPRVASLSVNLGRIEKYVGDFLPIDEEAKALLAEEKKRYSSSLFVADVRFSDAVPPELINQHDKWAKTEIFQSDNEVTFPSGLFSSIKPNSKAAKHKVSSGAIKPPKLTTSENHGVLVSLDGTCELKLVRDKRKGPEQVVMIPPGAVAR